MSVAPDSKQFNVCLASVVRLKLGRSSHCNRVAIRSFDKIEIKSRRVVDRSIDFARRFNNVCATARAMKSYGMCSFGRARNIYDVKKGRL